jgi:hypothetical protein
LIHCHMFVHSHMAEDVHPPGESGMNGITAILEVTGEPDPDGSGPVEAIGDLLRTSTESKSGASVVSLLAIVGVLLYVGRKRIRPHLSTTKS